MSILNRWRKQVTDRHRADSAIEAKYNISSNTPKSVSPSDIERLEEEKVPWLREKRRQARRNQ